eukprot:TRINITY_DN11917_c3_g2_i13.p3 TRINITY_DN11917_c3_g2~~TRINITY_DN11917_c3_g2_i13.p3  ORF type:complete len:173 (+),score=16.63 TRINITY_DN11917_c3_g2_i13:1023-1541(+)
MALSNHHSRGESDSMPSGCVRRLCLPLDSDQPVDGDLIFDASFESANLGKVERVSAIEWNVYIRSDLCSPKHALWYYFTVTNAMAEQTVLFNIHGLCKTRSLLRDGMAPVVRTSSGLWQRMPASNTFYHQPEPGESKTYISSFVYQFADDNVGCEDFIPIMAKMRGSTHDDV